MGKIKKKVGEFDFYLLITIIILVLIGIMMVWSASSYTALHENNDENFYLWKQLRNVTVGLIGMVVAMHIDYRKYKKFTRIIGVASIILLIVVLLVGETRNGATRWIKVVGDLTIQPSEIAKYAVVFILAKCLDKDGDKIRKLSTVIKYLILSGVFAGLILAENNMSICAIIMMVTVIVLFIDGAKFVHVLGICCAGLAAGVGLILAAPYRMARALNFLNPWEDPLKHGYQLIQSFYALGSGGLLGVGLGQSRQKAFYIPEPHNDFIFAIIGEELGFIGCLVIILIFCFFIIRGIGIAFKAKDTYGTLIAMGITSIIALQAIINIAVVSGSMPVTGVPLPFISYGGTAVMINLYAMGVLLNVSRQNNRKK